MDYKWIGSCCIAVFLTSCSIKDESPVEPIDESLSSSSSWIEAPISSATLSSSLLVEWSSSSEGFSSSILPVVSSLSEVSSSSILTIVSSSSMVSSSSVWTPPPPEITEDTLLGISGDSVRALLQLSATPLHVQMLMQLWDSLAPFYVDTLLSSSLDSSWMLPEEFDRNWCTFDDGPYDVYIYTKRIYHSPSLTRLAKVYASEKLVYSSDEFFESGGVKITKDVFSCHSFGFPVEPIGCRNEGIHVAFPDGSHLEAMPKNGYLSNPAYTWTPSGPWQMNIRYQACPT